MPGTYIFATSSGHYTIRNCIKRIGRKKKEKEEKKTKGRNSIVRIFF